MATYIRNELKVYGGSEFSIGKFSIVFEEGYNFGDILDQVDEDRGELLEKIENFYHSNPTPELNECSGDDFLQENSEGTLFSQRFMFETIYHPPKNMLKLVSECYPDLIFELFYLDESGGEGCVSYQAGKTLTEFHSDAPTWVSLRFGDRSRFVRAIPQGRRFIEAFDEKQFMKSMADYAHEYKLPIGG